MARPKKWGVARDYSDVSEIDWARLAAYIDGEGHIGINENKHKNGKVYTYIIVVVTNTDPRLIRWLLTTFNGGVMRGRNQRHNPKWRDVLKWKVTTRDAEAILDRCLPYFITKRDQAEIALAFVATLQNFRRGNPLPQEIRDLRSQYREQLQEARHRTHPESDLRHEPTH